LLFCHCSLRVVHLSSALVIRFRAGSDFAGRSAAGCNFSVLCWRARACVAGAQTRAATGATHRHGRRTARRRVDAFGWISRGKSQVRIQRLAHLPVWLWRLCFVCGLSSKRGAATNVFQPGRCCAPTLNARCRARTFASTSLVVIIVRVQRRLATSAALRFWLGTLRTRCVV